MRVISGLCRGRRLKSPRGKKIRPTSDKVKAAFFNIISDSLNNASFLDLFSGTGSMGIEALSRGAKRCVFVENDPQSLKLIRENLALTGMESLAEILPYNVNAALKILSQKKESFHIAYLDPPYNFTGVLNVLHSLHQHKLIFNGGIIGIEREKRNLDALLETTPFQPWQTRVYGNTMLIFLKELDMSSTE